MFPGNLPRPLLSLIFEPVANIQYSDEDALSRLWSVFAKVSDAMSEGKRLENMTWRLWHRAYSRRGMILSSHPATTGNDSDLRISSALPLSPSLSFSSSSEVTSGSSGWDRDTAVNDEEETLPNGNTSSRVVPTTPCLGNGKPASHISRTSPAPHPSAQPSYQHSSGYPNKASEIPATLPVIPSISQDLDRESLSDNSQPGRHPLQGFQSSDKADVRNATARIASPSSFSAQFQRSLASPGISLKGSPSSESSLPVPAPSEVLTVGKLISRMLAEKVVLAKPACQFATEDPTALNSDHHLSSPKVEIIAPPDSPVVNVSSAFTSAASTPRQSFPTLIVVNPTPHPTPPATPSNESSEKMFDIVRSPIPAIHPSRLALGPGVTETETSLSPSSHNDQLATPVSIGQPSFSINNHVTYEQSLSQQLSNTVVPDSTVLTTSSSPNTLFKRMSGASNMIALPERPTNSGEFASHLPTPAAELTPDMGTSRATTAPIETPAPAISEDKKFFLAVPHSGSGGSGHDSTESPDSIGTGSINSRRRGTARGSPLIDVRDTHAQCKSSSRCEEELSSSFSASSPAGRPQSISSSKGGSVISRGRPRATFMVHSGVGRRKGSSKKGIKNLYKKESEKRMSSAEHGPIDEDNFKGKGVIKSERDDVTSTHPPTPPKTNNATLQVPRVKTMHQHLSRLNQNPQHQTNLRQLPTNPPPRRPMSPSQSRSSNVANGVSPDMTDRHSEQLQRSVQLIGQLSLGHIPPSKQSRTSAETADTSSDYSTTDTDDDSWESESGSEDKKENVANEQHSRTRRSDLARSERTQHHGHSNNNRQRDPGESVRDAALEAQRQRDMFQKLPPRTYSNLGQLPRTKSGLSLLFRPDPELFPVGHPYRTSRSSQDLLARNWSHPAPPPAMTAIQQRASPVAPVEANVTVSSVRVKETDGPLTRRSSTTQVQRNGGNYRPRAKPADQEEESDSSDDEIPVPNSVAERRLAAIAKQGSRSQAHPPLAKQKQQPNIHMTSQTPIPRNTTMPILPHQFLPEPAPLQLPHEIRRRIISEELDEELRRNLLWERSQNQMPGRPARLHGSILPGPWRTLTPINPTKPPAPEAQPTADSQGQTRLFSTQRTKSWAGEYHATGW